MRIIGGKFKGKKLLKPKDKETRPLKDLTKESIFNIINHSNKFTIDIKKAQILDLFSGVGSPASSASGWSGIWIGCSCARPVAMHSSRRRGRPKQFMTEINFFFALDLVWMPSSGGLKDPWNAFR